MVKALQRHRKATHAHSEGKAMTRIEIEDADSVEINRRINCANPAYAGPWINLAGQRYTLRNDASYQMFDYGLLANAPREAGAVAPSLHADVGTANRKETER